MTRKNDKKMEEEIENMKKKLREEGQYDLLDAFTNNMAKWDKTKSILHTFEKIDEIEKLKEQLNDKKNLYDKIKENKYSSSLNDFNNEIEEFFEKDRKEKDEEIKYLEMKIQKIVKEVSFIQKKSEWYSRLNITSEKIADFNKFTEYTLSKLYNNILEDLKGQVSLIKYSEQNEAENTKFIELFNPELKRIEELKENEKKRLESSKGLEMLALNKSELEREANRLEKMLKKEGKYEEFMKFYKEKIDSQNNDSCFKTQFIAQQNFVPIRKYLKEDVKKHSLSNIGMKFSQCSDIKYKQVNDKFLFVEYATIEELTHLLFYPLNYEKNFSRLHNFICHNCDFMKKTLGNFEAPYILEYFNSIIRKAVEDKKVLFADGLSFGNDELASRVLDYFVGWLEMFPGDFTIDDNQISANMILNKIKEFIPKEKEKMLTKVIDFLDKPYLYALSFREKNMILPKGAYVNEKNIFKWKEDYIAMCITSCYCDIYKSIFMYNILQKKWHLDRLLEFNKKIKLFIDKFWKENKMPKILEECEKLKCYQFLKIASENENLKESVKRTVSMLPFLQSINKPEEIIPDLSFELNKLNEIKDSETKKFIEYEKNKRHNISYHRRYFEQAQRIVQPWGISIPLVIYQNHAKILEKFILSLK